MGGDDLYVLKRLVFSPEQEQQSCLRQLEFHSFCCERRSDVVYFLCQMGNSLGGVWGEWVDVNYESVTGPSFVVNFR